MPSIIIDGKRIECRDGITVLQAALEAGWDVPHYCYHPSLTVVASCRLCLMEMKMPHPKTKELDWSPKLIPSCQTLVRDDMEVRFNSQNVVNNRLRVMEYYLVNHPLDCPVCDQAGECYLQDYSLKFGESTSRMVEQKHKNPKKDIGPRTLLYQDRCVMCSRCVRFTDEISGTGELCVVNRGNRAEIDVFPGVPLDNRLQGNVVDICPVGSLLDKDFLFAQRVWFLKSADSICRGCSTGCSIRVDQNKNRVWRLKPRFNPEVNDYWICDDGRFGWKFVHDEKRLTNATVRRGHEVQYLLWESVPTLVRQRFDDVVEKHGPGAVGVQLSPEMACEEAWLLATFIRHAAPDATLALGDVCVGGQEERFPIGSTGEDVKFTIRPEKHPNRRGVEAVIEAMGGNTAASQDVWKEVGEGRIKAVWVVGGYPNADWTGKDVVKAAGGLELLVVQDIFPSKLSDAANIVLPGCPWVEREGTFMNHDGLVQPFERALNPPEGMMTDGQYLFAIAGYEGLYTGERVREMMGDRMPVMRQVYVPPEKPKHQH